MLYVLTFDATLKSIFCPQSEPTLPFAGPSQFFGHGIENVLKDSLGFILEDHIMNHLPFLTALKKCMPITSFLK